MTDRLFRYKLKMGVSHGGVKFYVLDFDRPISNPDFVLKKFSIINQNDEFMPWSRISSEKELCAFMNILAYDISSIEVIEAMSSTDIAWSGIEGDDDSTIRFDIDPLSVCFRRMYSQIMGIRVPILGTIAKIRTCGCDGGYCMFPTDLQVDDSSFSTLGDILKSYCCGYYQVLSKTDKGEMSITKVAMNSKSGNQSVKMSLNGKYQELVTYGYPDRGFVVMSPGMLPDTLSESDSCQSEGISTHKRYPDLDLDNMYYRVSIGM